MAGVPDWGVNVDDGVGDCVGATYQTVLAGVPDWVDAGVPAGVDEAELVAETCSLRATFGVHSVTVTGDPISTQPPASVATESCSVGLAPCIGPRLSMLSNPLAAPNATVHPAASASMRVIWKPAAAPAALAANERTT